ncbi:MAG TPA: T9SS type A sorting domain-containing protein, partial [Candidatus Kapabacteria bacterium]|nr:T9SS type A sorting domain-containing protein [Candidatus Kapabacteria bacterium]
YHQGDPNRDPLEPTFYRVIHVSHSRALAVAGLGRIFQTSDNGATWQEYSTGASQYNTNASRDFHGIAYLTGNIAFVVGDDGMILRTATHTNPIANILADTVGTVGKVTRLNGRNSIENDGDTLEFSWQFIKVPLGSRVQFTDSTLSFESFTPDSVGDYVVMLVIDDDENGVDTAYITIHVITLSVVQQNGITISANQLQNYPNPFTSSTIIRYYSSEKIASLKICDALGRKVADLTKQVNGAEVVFDGSALPAGVYVCRLQAGGSLTQKLMILTK